VDTNVAEFNREIDQFAKTVPDKVSTMQRKIVFGALRLLCKRTPIKTGYARFNWQTTFDMPAEGQLNGTDLTPDGTATVTRGLAAITPFKPYTIVWISNNVDYIEFLEHGSSKQAANGMLAVTVADLRTLFEGVVR
jgi:hypothetical protein